MHEEGRGKDSLGPQCAMVGLWLIRQLASDCRMLLGRRRASEGRYDR